MRSEGYLDLSVEKIFSGCSLPFSHWARW